ncbi:hypothetical protein TNCV_1368001 [Trichonephila clavipes]|nr:hypothetical protein TNCV_1368001 [Trichonephila clavipes]
MEGKSCAWAEDDVVTVVDIFGLCLDDSGARHILESDGLGCKQLIHLGSRLQSVEACPTDAHIEQRTSMAGLALDSATSSGLDRAPRSAMQDPIQAPPGSTRQAGLYTS